MSVQNKYTSADKFCVSLLLQLLRIFRFPKIFLILKNKCQRIKKILHLNLYNPLIISYRI